MKFNNYQPEFLSATVFTHHMDIVNADIAGAIILETSVEHGCVENLGVKDKESLEENGLSPCRERFCRISRPDFFTKP